MGKMKERIVLEYIILILVGNIYYFNEQNRKIKVKMLIVL